MFLFLFCLCLSLSLSLHHCLSCSMHHLPHTHSVVLDNSLSIKIISLRKIKKSVSMLNNVGQKKRPVVVLLHKKTQTPKHFLVFCVSIVGSYGYERGVRSKHWPRCGCGGLTNCSSGGNRSAGKVVLERCTWFMLSCHRLKIHHPSLLWPRLKGKLYAFKPIMLNI